MTIEETEHFEIVCSVEDHEAWLRARRTGIGASDMPAVCGVTRWGSPLSVFVSKVDTEAPIDDEGEYQYWGRRLEHEILAEFATVTGREVRAAGYLLRSKKWPWLITTLDGEQVGDSLCAPSAPWYPVEVKNTQDRRSWRDGVPREVWVQCQSQLAVVGAPMGSVAVLQSGCQFAWKDVLRDDAFILEHIVPDSKALWGKVVAGGPPPGVDGTEHTTKALARIFPDANETTVALPGEFTGWHADLVQLKAQQKEIEAAREKIENEIRFQIGEAGASYGQLQTGETYSWKPNRKGNRTLRAPTEE